MVALARRRDRHALVEAGLLVAHVALFVVGPFLVLPPLQAALFVVVTQAVFGFYLGSASSPTTWGCRPWPPATSRGSSGARS